MYPFNKKNNREDLDTEANQIPAETRSDKARKARNSLLSWIVASIIAISIGIIIGYYLYSFKTSHEPQTNTNNTIVKIASDFQKRDQSSKIRISGVNTNTGQSSIRASSSASSFSSSSSIKIVFHGGQIMSAPIKVHVLMYGSFTGTYLLKSFIRNLQNSNWWSITKGYRNPNTGDYAGTSIALGRVINQTVSSTYLSDSDIGRMLKRAFPNPSANDLHVMLSDKTVSTSSGLCNKFCGWHTNSGDFKYIYVGSPLSCQRPSLCSALTTSNAPNGDFEMDSMISVVAHELTEAVTDPVGDGWYFDNAKEDENADYCNWNLEILSLVTAENIISE